MNCNHMIGWYIGKCPDNFPIRSTDLEGMAQSLLMYGGDIETDGRLRGIMRFDHCPMCGERIHWDMLRAQHKLREL